MVGLSVILENYSRDLSESHHHHHHHHHRLHHHVIRKGSCMIKSFTNSTNPTTNPPTPSPRVFSKMRTMASLCTSSASGFLEYCFLCRQKLLHGKDIYMYKGDRAFCSEECRYRHILMDEEEDQKQVEVGTAENGCTREYKHSMAATSSPTGPPPPHSSAKGARNVANNNNNTFAY